MCFSEQHINRIDHNITAGTKLQQHQHKRQSVLKAVHHQAAIRRSRGGNHVAKYSTTTVAEGNIPVITSAARTKPKPVSHRTSCLVDIKFTDHCDDSAIFNTTLVTLNTRSVCNKTASINQFIVDNDVPLFAVTESWLGKTADAAITQDLVPETHSIVSAPRKNKRGGGVALIYKNGFDIKTIDSTNDNKFKQFEHLDCLVKSGRSCIRLGVVYRPPNKTKVPEFMSEWAVYLERLLEIPQEVVILGDLNFHSEIIDDAEACQFKEMLDDYGFQQLVEVPTHNAGGSLDVAIVRKTSVDTLVLAPPHVAPSGVGNGKGTFTDHLAVHLQISMSRPKRPRKSVSFRRIRDIDIVSFREDISTRLSTHNEDDSAEDFIQYFNSSMSDILEIHAPLITKTITVRPDTAWYTPDLHEIKRSQRRAERKASKTGQTVDAQIFDDISDSYNSAIIKAKETYYNKQIVDNKDDRQSLFKITNKLLGKEKNVKRPSHTSKEELSNRFSDYFEEKIDKIKSDLESTKASLKNISVAQQVAVEPDFIGDPLSRFEPATVEEVTKIIRQSPSKSCQLDPLPTSLLKECISEVAPFITEVMNQILSEGQIPQYFKHALVNPLLKKQDLDQEVLKNYRPVSNLPFTSKILEKVVSKRIKGHLAKFSLEDPLQSAYKCHHSTETALIKVHNDLTAALESGSGAVLIMLDLSAAFDVLDHKILRERFRKHFGITDDALELLDSYFFNRTQSVVIDGVTSEMKVLKSGVPQGSHFGPGAYGMYSKPVGAIIRLHGLLYHCYADDSQIYLVLLPNQDLNQTVISLENCVNDISRWMTHNLLKLNEDKTELIYFQSQFLQQPSPTPSLRLGGNIITPVKSVKNLGCYLDSTLTMETQVSAIIKTCCFQVQLIGKIRKYLDTESCKTLVNANITSRLDYCNAILLGSADGLFIRLQRVQNMAARLVTLTPKANHDIDPVLRELHWLPVKERVKFKVLTYIFKAREGIAPSYLSELLTSYVPTRNLRSIELNQLEVPKPKEKIPTYGQKNFARSGPGLWNELPRDVRCIRDLSKFKKQLKTHLFTVRFKTRNIYGDLVFM